MGHVEDFKTIFFRFDVRRNLPSPKSICQIGRNVMGVHINDHEAPERES